MGQFKDETRKHYGVKTVFDITTNAEAVVHCYKDSKAIAMRQGHTGSQEELDRWTYGFYHDGPNGSGSKGSKIFSSPNGVKAWIGPAEKSIGHPEGARHPRSSGLTDDSGVPFTIAGTPDRPFVSDFTGVPNPLGPVSSGPLGLPQPPAGHNYLAGTPSPAGLLSSPGQAPFFPDGNALTGMTDPASPGQALTANPLLAVPSLYTPVPRNYPTSPINYLASPPTIFQEPYRTGYARPDRRKKDLRFPGPPPGNPSIP